jgi:transposase
MAAAEVRIERIDDVPLLVRQQAKMGIPEVLNAVVTPHGNRQGLSVGWLATVWLSYILSEADHRMSEVEPWAADRLAMLQALLPEAVTVQDFTDDRLADVLRVLSADETWIEIESQLSQRLVRVYDLEPGPIRVDSTTAAVYHDTEGHTLFRHGHSKDYRPDLAQFKVMLGTLDPLGMPLATVVAPGNEVDGGLYLPTIRQTQDAIGQGGRLYIGDSKMAALATRAAIQAAGDYYLTPLPQTGNVPAALVSLLEPVWDGTQSLQSVHPPSDDGSPSAEPGLLALGYETTRSQQATVNNQTVTWDERVLVVYSPTLVRQQRRGLAKRLKRAMQAIRALTPSRGPGRRQWGQLEPLQHKVQTILHERGVEGLLEVTYEREVEPKSVRRYGGRPARTEGRVRYVVHVVRNREAIQQVRREMGWRLYVCNAPVEVLSLAEAVIAYRGAPRIERNFQRLKGHPLGIRPLYVQRDDHAKGMVRLLSLALRVLTLLEHTVRQSLRAAGESLAGLYAGNPKRETARPTTERLLQAFRGITLSLIDLPDQTIRHVTPLSDLQRRVLNLLGLSPLIYDDLVAESSEIPP